MLKLSLLPVIFVAGVSLSSCVSTNTDGVRQQKYHATAVSGERTRIGRDWSLNPDCSRRGDPSVRVLQAPQHGKLDIVREDVFPYWEGGKCNSRKVLGSAQYYTSDRGFIGNDSVVMRHSHGNGSVLDSTTEIKVVK